VASWAADLKAAPDDDVAMFAWRRANVSELNRLGREAWVALGHLDGPEDFAAADAHSVR